ncbi:MAG: ABC transporter ATP-binding protein [Marinilabiliales bacterium]|nr:MAG: ABC transporter ATP-binding protein [Marinilabiliales bacterium]
MIEINKLIKRYKGSDSNAVDSLNLNIQKGEFYGLLGPNGAGKTTTISMLCGLLSPTSGQIKISGLDINYHSQKAKSIIGVVPQEIALFEDLTAKENLRFFAEMHGMKKSDFISCIDIYLDKFSLKDKANKRVKTFSGGMKRRLNLIAGILHSPQILFLDEPTVGIDVQSRNVIAEFLHEINKNGMTIIYTSHMMEEAEKLCSHISIIDFGKEIANGKPAEIIQKNENCNNLEDIFLSLTGRRVRE